MIKDLNGKVIQGGDAAVFVPAPGALIEGLVLDVSPVMSIPGGPPMGVRKVQIAFMLDIMLPDNGQFPTLYVTAKGDSEASQDLMKRLQKLLDGMKVGSDGGKLVLS